MALATGRIAFPKINIKCSSASLSAESENRVQCAEEEGACNQLIRDHSFKELPSTIYVLVSPFTLPKGNPLLARHICALLCGVQNSRPWAFLGIHGIQVSGPNYQADFGPRKSTPRTSAQTFSRLDSTSRGCFLESRVLSVKLGAP